MGKIFKVLLPVGAIASAVVVAGLLRATKPETPANPALERSWPIQTVAVVIADIRPELRLFGQVRAGREVALRAPVAGPVITIGADFVDGGMVAAGDLLVEIDPFTYEKDLIERRASAREARARLDELGARRDAESALLGEDRRQLAISQRDLDRRRQLLGGAVSEKTLDDSRAASSRAQGQVLQREQQIRTLSAQRDQQSAVIERLEASVDRAERALADTRLTAPFDGYLADIATEVGERLTPGDRIGRLIDSDRLEAELFLSDAQFARAFDPTSGRPFGRATVIWRAGEQAHVFDAEIERIESEIDPTTGGIHVYARILGLAPEVPLRPGAFIEARLAERLYIDVARLPATALHHGDTVYAVVEERLEPRAVTVIGHDTGSILVRGELGAGEPILVTRFTEVGPGVKVIQAP
ncbi:MAG: efflux RND transporter periplasmic adaptor subunit [Alphaproteobacteria bacterium]|nr:efflux RND transporter periplasmic adaptor subunit [Alphaproteobacteria bacterium]MDP6517151.1 efflux RND transporter periplasmic adaptor subunit [Alphaproteobacteria bacterium]